MDPPEIPAKIDPYEIAYLRGGANEVTRVAIASFIQRGLLNSKPVSALFSAGTDSNDPPAGKYELTPILTLANSHMAVFTSS